MVVKPGSKSKEPILGCTNYKSDKNRTGCNRMMNRDYYLKWVNNSIGNEEPSFDECGLTNNNEEFCAKVHMPQMIQLKKQSIHKELKPQKINKTSTNVLHIEKDGFDVICDASGNILTDMELLKKIREWRYNKAKTMNIRPYLIFNNIVLVDLATRHPMTLEELRTISGIGEKKIELYGDDIIGIIKKHNLS